MTWLLGLIGGKIPATIIGVLFLISGLFGFVAYKMIQKNGAQRQKIGELKADIVNIKKEIDLRDAAFEQSRIDQAAAAEENAALEIKHSMERRQLVAIIVKLRAEALSDEQKKDIDCLDRRVPAPIIEHLFGLR